MSCGELELAAVPGAVRFLDHSHPATHVMILLDGQMVEDGVVYRPGTVRISRADDRHFLRFLEDCRCLVVEIADAASLRMTGARQVLWCLEVVEPLARAGGDVDLLQRAGRIDWRDLSSDRPAPDWLVELEARRSGGEFVRTPGVSVLARQAGVSREHLSRSYLRQFGTTIAGALRAQQLRAGYDAVTRSARPIAEIAGACGFADQSHMTRAFADWIGVTPGALRRQFPDITSVQDGRSSSRL